MDEGVAAAGTADSSVGAVPLLFYMGVVRFAFAKRIETLREVVERLLAITG